MRIDQLKQPKDIFFDVNETLLNLEPLKQNVTEVPEGRKELVKLWFTTLANGFYFQTGQAAVSFSGKA